MENPEEPITDEDIASLKVTGTGVEDVRNEDSLPEKEIKNNKNNTITTSYDALGE